MRVASAIVMVMEQEMALPKLSRSNTKSVRLTRRAKIALLAVLGHDNARIVKDLCIGFVQVVRRRERYTCSALVWRESNRVRRVVTACTRPLRWSSCVKPRKPCLPTPPTGARTQWPRPMESVP